MLKNFSSSRSLKDDLKLGSLTAFSAGMINVASVIVFFAFTSNVTGHYAILAEEIAKGNWYQAAVVFAWIFAFFTGNFISNLIIIHSGEKNRYLAHAFPLILEIVCLLFVGIYGQFYYQETLTETEFLVCITLFAMGIQNGLTASISNFRVKTTHLTGLTTDLGILFAMFTQKKYRKNKELRGKARLLISIAGSYLAGGIISGIIYLNIQFLVFLVACWVILMVVMYDFYQLNVTKFLKSRKALTFKWKTATTEP